MKTESGFTLMNPDEFIKWIENHEVNRIINVIQNHHTYIPSYQHFNGKNHFERLKAMRDYHVIVNGWKDIAQNLTTFPDGTIATGRPLQDIPAGIKNQNTQGICIEHFGNFDQGNDKMTTKQEETIILVNAVLCKKFGLTPSIETIVYHHWFNLITGQRTGGGANTKSCPGTAFFGGNSEDAANKIFIPLIINKLKEISVNVSGENTPVKYYYHVTAGNLNVRIGPGKNYLSAGTISNGSIVPVYDSYRSWLKIDKSGKWVSRNFGWLLGEASVNAQMLNIRSGPGTAYPITGTLKKEDRIFIYATEHKWSRISVNEQWIHNDYITVNLQVPG